MNYTKTLDTLAHKEVLVNKTAIVFFGIIAGITLTALSAFVRIPLPFTPVPLTLQTMVVVLLGATLGRKYGAITQASYVLIGILGAPIFTGASFGLMHLAGPTGGYLVGFIATAYLVGKLLPKTNSVSFLRIFSMMVIGSIPILLFGTIQLSFLMHLSWDQAFLIGFLPFIPGDIIKSIIAAGIYYRIQNRCQIFKSV
jgi:biotin transport system substrate-specific component